MKKREIVTSKSVDDYCGLRDIQILCTIYIYIYKPHRDDALSELFFLSYVLCFFFFLKTVPQIILSSMR